MGIKKTSVFLAACAVGIGFYALVPSWAQQSQPTDPDPTLRITPIVEADTEEAPIAETDCPFFGPDRENFLPRSRNVESGVGRITRQFYSRGGNRGLEARLQSFSGATTGKGGTDAG